MVNMTSDKRKSYRFSIDGAREVHYCEWKLNVILLCKDNIVLQTFCKQYLPSRQKERENIRAPNSICNYWLSASSSQTLTIINSRGRSGRKSNLQTTFAISDVLCSQDQIYLLGPLERFSNKMKRFLKEIDSHQLADCLPVWIQPPGFSVENQVFKSLITLCGGKSKYISTQSGYEVFTQNIYKSDWEYEVFIRKLLLLFFDMNAKIKIEQICWDNNLISCDIQHPRCLTSQRGHFKP